MTDPRELFEIAECHFRGEHREFRPRCAIGSHHSARHGAGIEVRCRCGLVVWYPLSELQKQGRVVA